MTELHVGRASRRPSNSNSPQAQSNHSDNFNNPAFTRCLAPGSLIRIAAAISGNVNSPKNRSRKASAWASGNRDSRSCSRSLLSRAKSCSSGDAAGQQGSKSASAAAAGCRCSRLASREHWFSRIVQSQVRKLNRESYDASHLWAQRNVSCTASSAHCRRPNRLIAARKRAA